MTTTFKCFASLGLLVFSALCQAENASVFKSGFYTGGIGGLGSTTWQGLVPSQKNQNDAMSLSTPVRVREGGNVWGWMAGYELSPYFALEANYMHYPKARVSFDEFSIFSFDHQGLDAFETDTNTWSLIAKVMLVIPNTNARLFSSAGISNLHRKDIILDKWRLTPTFGVGVNYRISDHLMGELGGNYTAGFGESQLNPTDTYFPFLYSVNFRLAYFF